MRSQGFHGRKKLHHPCSQLRVKSARKCSWGLRASCRNGSQIGPEARQAWYRFFLPWNPCGVPLSPVLPLRRQGARHPRHPPRPQPGWQARCSSRRPSACTAALPIGLPGTASCSAFARPRTAAGRVRRAEKPCDGRRRTGGPRCWGLGTEPAGTCGTPARAHCPARTGGAWDRPSTRRRAPTLRGRKLLTYWWCGEERNA